MLMGSSFIFILFYYLFIYLFIFFGLFAFSRAAPEAYGGSQARSRIGAVAAGLCYSHSNMESELRLQPYTTAHGNARSLTH